MTSQPGAMAPRVPAVTLADVAVPAIGRGEAAQWLRAALLVVGGAALTAISAQIVWFAPWNPLVPYTFQTAAVLLVGTVLGWRLGLASMLLYVAAGAAGLGVFADGSSGLAADGALRASVGYLGGFVLAGALVGWLAERGWDRSPVSTIGLMVIGNLVIYAVGVPVLIAVTGLDLATALQVGALDFIPWDLIKIAAAAAVLPIAWRAVGSDEAHHP
jgi:biotin transport system substrate-specific component